MARGRKALSIDVKIARLEAQLELLIAQKTGLPIKSIPPETIEPIINETA